MRTKEVENAIERGNTFIEENLDKIGGIQGFSIKNGKITFKTKQLKILLNYISELEEEMDSARRKIQALKDELEECIHKDKVYEIVEEINNQVDVYNNAVDKFNKLLEE